MPAPRGSKRIFGQVEAYIRNHPDKAAKYLGVSEGYARRIQRHVERGRPIGEIIKTSRGVERWKGRFAEARQLSYAEKVSKEVKAAGLKSVDLAEAAKLDPKETYRALSRMRRGKPVDPKTVRALRAASEAVKKTEPYLEDGVTIYPSEKVLRRDVKAGFYPQAVPINRFSPFKQDIINFIKTISVEYFVAVWNEAEEMHFVFDVRSPEERRQR